MFNFLDYITEVPISGEESAVAVVAGAGVAIVIIYLVYFLLIGAFAVTMYVLNALPLYKIGKKLGYDKCFLPWIPVSLIPFFVLGDLSGRKDFTVSPKIDKFLKIGTRKKSYIVYIVLYVLFLAFTLVAGLGMMAFPLMMESGVLSEELSVILMMVYMMVYMAVTFLAAGVFTALSIIYYYVYLRDLIDIFKPDRNSNKTIALILALTNSLASGLVIPIYLLILSKSEPLPEEPFCGEADEYGFAQ